MFLARAIAASRRRFDLDAADYFARIVAAGSTISEPNKAAVNAFVTGCKADGIWSAIKASCLLAGPDTLAGALVPLVGPAPTNFNFVTGDYNRVTGLVGDGSSKYLDSNRNNNADPQDSNHLAVYISALSTVGKIAHIGAGSPATSGTTRIGTTTVSNNTFVPRSRTSTAGTQLGVTLAIGFAGISRSVSSGYTARGAGNNYSITQVSQSPYNGNVEVFKFSGDTFYSDSRQSYYSIGESLDLVLLDARITTYMASIS
jgi:hypothetical protein